MQLSARNAEISLKPSAMLIALLIVVHGLAIGALFETELDDRLCLALGFALLISLVHELQYLRRASPRSLSFSDGRCSLALASGEQIVARLESPVVLLSWLVVMNFRLGRRRIPVVVLPDSAEREAFRRFRVFLNVNGPSLFDEKRVSQSEGG